MDINLVKQYAEFAVKIGVNPQPGADAHHPCAHRGAFFARACAEAAYAAGREGSGGALFGQKAVPH